MDEGPLIEKLRRIEGLFTHPGINLKTAVDDGESPQSIGPPGFARNPQQTLRVCLRFRTTLINPSLWMLHPPSTAVFRMIHHISG
jgi:hypothetical protein